MLNKKEDLDVLQLFEVNGQFGYSKCKLHKGQKLLQKLLIHCYQVQDKKVDKQHQV